MKFRHLLLLGLIGSWGCLPSPADPGVKPKNDGQPSSKDNNSKDNNSKDNDKNKAKPTDKQFMKELTLPKNPPTKSPEFKVTHLVSGEEYYYIDGPQQMRAPDGKFKEGTKVQLVQDSGSYSVVVSEDGVRAYVSTASLKPVK